MRKSLLSPERDLKIGFLQLGTHFFAWGSFFSVIHSYYFAQAEEGDKEWTFAVADNDVGVTPSIKNQSSKYSEGYTREKNTLGQA